MSHTVVDRLVIVPLAVFGVFPHLRRRLAVLDPLLAIGAWTLISRERR